MPRQAGIDALGAVHHIIARGIERGEIFRDGQDRDAFLKKLGELVVEIKTQCFAWALIPNHYSFSGHASIMGKNKNGRQSVNEVLLLFGSKTGAARRSYRDFVVR